MARPNIDQLFAGRLVPSDDAVGASPGTRGGHAGVELDRRRPERMSAVKSPSSWVVGVAGLAIGVVIALRLLIPNGMDPTVFLALGDDSPVQTNYARRLLGDVRTRRDLGHDGRFFFAQANDPWLLRSDMNAAVLDRPVYRSQRMLFPLIAGGLGSFPPGVVVWSMLITNLLAMGIGALVAAELATRWGASAWLGARGPAQHRADLRAGHRRRRDRCVHLRVGRPPRTRRHPGLVRIAPLRGSGAEPGGDGCVRCGRVRPVVAGGSPTDVTDPRSARRGDGRLERVPPLPLGGRPPASEGAPRISRLRSSGSSNRSSRGSGTRARSFSTPSCWWS